MILNTVLWLSHAKVGVNDIGDGAWAYQNDEALSDNNRYTVAQLCKSVGIMRARKN